MVAPDDATADPSRLPDGLLERLDSLDVPQLRAVLDHVEERLESQHSPLEREIMEDATGEIVAIEDQGAYALVRKRSPDPDEPGANTDVVSLYHVSREPHLDGTESLHWAYLGDVSDDGAVTCEHCGRTFDQELARCPHCSGTDADRGTEE